MITAAVALVAAIAAAIGRRAPEAVVALVGAAVLIVFGVLEPDDALDEAKAIGPTLVVLASLLVLGDGCERAGLFDALAARMAVRARGNGPRLLAYVFGAAVAVTAVLGLDATVVLLTPAAFAAAAKARLASRPHVYATSHLANSASPPAPGLQPHEPARVQRHGPLVRGLRRAHGAADRGRRRDRVDRDPARVQRPRSKRPGARRGPTSRRSRNAR